MSSPTTVGQLIKRAAGRLARARLAYGHGIPTALDEASYLVLFVLELPPDDLTPHLDRRVTSAQAARVSELVAQRIRRRIPVAYLTHEAWLGDDRFYVDERVIVPRSFIAELLRERIEPWLPANQPVRRALDLCTGSGCLAIVMAKTFKQARIDALDMDSGALAVARRNVEDYRLQRRIRLLESDMFAAAGGARYDLIIANPPYVSAHTMRGLPPEYRHEPAIALASGKDGLDAVRMILRDAAAHLEEQGLLVFEVGHHRRRVERAFPRHPFIWPQTSGGDDCVFILGRGDLLRAAVPARPPSPARARAPARHRASRANAASRRK